MSLQTYSPSEVSLFVAVLYEVSGYSPDSLISISKDSPYYTTSKGGTGGVERIHNADPVYTLEVSLSQTSSTNSVLNALAVLDDATGRVVFPIFAKDSSGNSIFLSSSCWIESPPVASYSGDIETRTWTIICSDMIFGLAGNEFDRGLIEQASQLGSILGQAGANQGLF